MTRMDLLLLYAGIMLLVFGRRGSDGRGAGAG